jgi:hypothetical protein
VTYARKRSTNTPVRRDVEVKGVQEEDFTSRFSGNATPDFANIPIQPL